MSLKSLFTDHPASVDETYGEHLVMASSFGSRLLLAGLACMVHAPPALRLREDRQPDDHPLARRDGHQPQPQEGREAGVAELA